MKILYSDLILKKVFTEAGEFVGYVSNIVFDIDSYTIIDFHVSKKFLNLFFYNTISINTSLIISITEEKITIKDTLERAELTNVDKKISHQLDVNIQTQE
jgi:sporulation protein YlmC with PRC-barrel domain